MAKPHVLVIPSPAQGHVTPMMELAQCLVTQGVKVTFINTEASHKLVTNNCVNKDGFGDLHMVSVPDGLDPLEDRTDPCKLAFSMLQTMPIKLEQLIETTNKEDPSKVTCIIVDDSIGWAMQVAIKMGVRRATFRPASVATMVYILSYQKLIDDGIINKKGIPLTDEMIRLSETMPPIKPQNLPWVCIEDSATTEVIFQLVVQKAEASRLTERFICNSCIELEAAAFSMCPQLLPIGPLVARNRLANQAGQLWQEDTTCLTWLDHQPSCSVIYVAFGSSTTLNRTQFEELALGLEHSNNPFLWVVRPGLTKETTSDYLDGYTERVGSRGKIVSWAPQQNVLAHPSIACFMSHCGWNSTLEGVTNGVPFLCWPYFRDQFHNASYACDVWRTGIGFEKDEAGMITRDEIKSKIEHLLNDKTCKVRALEIKEKVISSVSKGGWSYRNLNSFVEWIKKNDADAN